MFLGELGEEEGSGARRKEREGNRVRRERSEKEDE